jgi:predicted nucleic acid-binding protein
VFLFDTSFVSAAVNSTSPNHAAAQAFHLRNAAFADKYYLSVVTLSEVQFGLNILKQRKPPVPTSRIEEVERRVSEIASLAPLLPVDRHVASEHARLRGAYAGLKVPRLVTSGGFRGKHVELWHEDITSPQLQISENDLWIAATALTHDLTLVTCDPDQIELRKAVPELRVEQV